MVATPSTMLELGTPLPSFRLSDFDGKLHSTDDHKAKPVLVMFICNHCPFVIHVLEKLVELAGLHQSKGIAVIGINSNDIKAYPDDSPVNMKKIAGRFQFSFPYLFDETQEVAKEFLAACTPDFYLFDASHHLVYRGQMDDSRPGNDIPVTGEDLTSAIDNLLDGKPISPDRKPSLGCNIKWKPGNEPNYFG